MELAELREFFEATYRFLHEYDEPRYEKEAIERLFSELEERMERLEVAFAPQGASLPVEIGGRFFFVYQNAGTLFKYALLELLEKDRAGGAWIGRGFLRIDPAQERVKYAREFAEIRERIASLGVKVN